MNKASHFGVKVDNLNTCLIALSEGQLNELQDTPAIFYRDKHLQGR